MHHASTFAASSVSRRRVWLLSVVIPALASCVASPPVPIAREFRQHVDTETQERMAKCVAKRGEWLLGACHLDFSPTSEQVAACRARGGAMVPGKPYDTCAWITKDVGKQCRDGDDCEGACVVPADTPKGSRVAGVCEAEAGRLECKNYLVEGVASGFICP